jgi:hypothetical protein
MRFTIYEVRFTIYDIRSRRFGTIHDSRIPTRGEAERSEANHGSRLIKKSPKNSSSGIRSRLVKPYYLSKTAKVEFILLNSGTIFFI